MISFSEQPGGGAQQDPAPKDAIHLDSIDTANHFAVGAKGGTLVLLNPPLRPITPREALALAAWLVTLAQVVAPELTAEEFQRTVAAIRNS